MAIGAIVVGAIVAGVTAGVISYGNSNNIESSSSGQAKARQRWLDEERKALGEAIVRGDSVYQQVNVSKPKPLKELSPLSSMPKLDKTTLPPLLSLTTPDKLWGEMKKPKSTYKAPDGTGANLYLNKDDPKEIRSLIDAITYGRSAAASKDTQGHGQTTSSLLQINAGAEQFSKRWSNIFNTLVWNTRGEGPDSLIKNVIVDPWIAYSEKKASFGQALGAVIVNSLTAYGDTMGQLTFSNTVKGIAYEGYDGFIKSLGLQNTDLAPAHLQAEGWSRESYRWNVPTKTKVGAFAANFALEIISDPFNLGRIVSKVVTRAGKAGVEKTAEQIIQEQLEQARAISEKTLTKITEDLGEEAVRVGLARMSLKLSQETVAKSISSSADELITETNKIIQDSLKDALTQGVKDTSKVLLKDIKANPTTLTERATSSIKQTLTTAFVKNGINPNSPTARAVIENITTELVKTIPLDVLTKQILSTVSGQAAKITHTINAYTGAVSKFAFRASFPYLKLGGLTITALSKVIPGGKATVQWVTQTKDSILRGAHGIVESALAPITNRKALKLATELQAQFGANILEPEVYQTTKDLFEVSSKLMDEVAAGSVAVGSKKVIRANMMSMQTTETAFTRQQYLRFARDARVYERIARDAGDLTKAQVAWDIYLRNQYNGIRNSAQYLEKLRAISKIENGAFDGIISRIVQQDEYIAASLVQGIVAGKPTSKLIEASKRVPQLTAADFKAMAGADVQTASIKDISKLNVRIQEKQYAIVTRNNFIEQEMILDAWGPILNAEQGMEETFVSIMPSLGPDIQALRSTLYQAQDQRQFLYTISNLGLSTGTPELDEYLTVALLDTFMGKSLKNFKAGVDSVDEMVQVWIDQTEKALQRYAGLDYMPNLKRGDLIDVLTAQLKVYTENLRRGADVTVILRNHINAMNRYADTIQLSATTMDARGALTGDLMREVMTTREAVERSNEAIARILDEVVILPNVLEDVTGATFINHIPGALQSWAGQTFAPTLTPILDITNIANFFEDVSGTRYFAFQTVQTTQQIADQATNIMRKLEPNIDTLIPATTKAAIDATYDEMLKVLSNATNIYESRALHYILSTVKDKPTVQKYAVLQSIATSDYRHGDITLQRMKQIVTTILEAPAYNEARVALSNIANYSTRPITIGTGFGVGQAYNITKQSGVDVALHELNNLKQAHSSTVSSMQSLESRLNMQADASPLVAEYTAQLHAVEQTFKGIVEPYTQMIEQSILRDRATDNLELATQLQQMGIFSSQDVITLRNIYDGVENTEEALLSLQRKVQEYNNRVLNVNDHTYEYINKQLGIDKETFNRLWVSTDWDEADFQAFNKIVQLLSADTVKRLPIPNAIKQALSDQVDYLGLFSIKLDTADIMRYAQGATIPRTSGILLNPKNLYNTQEYIGTLRHEMLHAALTRMPAADRARIVNDTFDHLLKGPHSAFIKDYYAYLHHDYRVSGSYPHLKDASFSMNDVLMREEVLANLTELLSEEGVDNLNKAYTHFRTGEHSNVSEWRHDYPALTDSVLEHSDDLMQTITSYYTSLLQEMANATPDGAVSLPYNLPGAPLNVGSPFEYTEEIINAYKQAEVTRLRRIIRHRLSMSAEDMAEDLARSGPFAFYSMSMLQRMRDGTGVWKWFDHDFNLRPHTIDTLNEAGIIIKRIPEVDAIVFILKKDEVSYLNNTSTYRGNVVRPVKDFQYSPFASEAMERYGVEAANISFNTHQDTMHTLRGASVGYSRGFKVSNDFYTKLFKGVGQDSIDSGVKIWQGIELTGDDWGGWSLQDLLVPKHYSTYRFEEMIMGDSQFARQFGVYYSNNPVINATNAVQQFSQVNKARVELTSNMFDQTFSLKTGIYAEYSAETIYELLKQHPEYRLVVMTPKGEGTGAGVSEIIPYNVAQVEAAREVGARLIPASWYKRLHNTLNHRIGSEGFLAIWQKYLYMYKFMALMNPMTFIRNWWDTDLKTAMEVQGDTLKYQFRANTLLKEYQSILYDLKDNIYSDKYVREYFADGTARAFSKVKHMDYELFQNIRHFDTWGPSGGLAKFIEPTADELSRQLVAEAMAEYKTWWQHISDINSKVFDGMSFAIGFNVERRDRLAMFLKALDDGMAHEQGFQWVTKTHFDYAFRSKADQVLEMLFPFLTFTQRNLEYYIDLFENQPHLFKYFADYQTTIWNVQDYTEEQITASKSIQRELLTGNIPLWKGEDGRDFYLKTSPSFMDAFNMFVNPIGVLKDRFYGPVRVIEKALTTNYKGENQFKSQPDAQKALDFIQMLPGGSMASQIVNSIGGPTPFPTNLAVGSYKRPPVRGYQPRPYTPLVQWFPKGYNSYYNKNTLRVKSYKQQQYLWNKHNFSTKSNMMYKNARISPLGNRVLDPYRASGQKLISKLYMSTKPIGSVKFKTNVSKKLKRQYTMNSYAINRARFSRH